MMTDPARRSFLSLPRGRWQQDEGVGLILVIGIGVFVFSVVIAATAFAVNGLKQAQQRTYYEQSLGVAEEGIDKTMSNLQTAFSRYNDDYPVPSNTWPHANPAAPLCNLPRVVWPATLNGVQVSDASGTFIDAGGRTAEQNEKMWATSQLDGLAGHPGCRTTDGNGKDASEYVVLKPASTLVNGVYPKYGKVYAMSAIPSFSDPKAARRVIKSEYLFLPYRPTHAVLTASDLELQGETKVLPAEGVPAGTTAVHSNGDLEVIGNATTVDGPLTATGNLRGAPQGAARVDIPTVEAEDLYFQAGSRAATAVGGWYDLCDGVLRTYSSLGPCHGADIPSRRNWDWDPASRTWTANADVLPGTYYADNANVKNGSSNARLSNITVIASRDDSGSCAARRYGNISWDHYDVASPSYPNLWFFADGDVAVTSNVQIGQNSSPAPVSGMVVAGDQLELYTQSNSTVGAVLAADHCKGQQPSDSLIGTNTIHNTLYFDPNSDAPFASFITNTLWLDYSQ